LSIGGRFLVPYLGRDRDVRINWAMEVTCHGAFPIYSSTLSMALGPILDSVGLRLDVFMLPATWVDLHSIDG
jgi:hypothetical protein